jgi:RNA polymerase sigma factor (sigma-70 family)
VIHTRSENVDGLLRQLAPQVLGVLARRYGQFDACEDAVQEALLAAARQWPDQGVPDHPSGWLIPVARRRLIDEMRADRARRVREDAAAGPEERHEPALDEPQPAQGDDTLTLLFLCCHPALTPASQISLTLRAVGGLTTAQIASAFLVPEATMAQRISRAKQTIKATGMEFTLPPEGERSERLRAVRHVLYLVFNEGYTASAGPELQRVELTDEAIRLARMLHRLVPADGETAGLLALMLLTHARRAARVGDDGALIALADQDRKLWDGRAIAEGVALLEHALASAPIGPYQLQAAIAAVHAEATSADKTDWRQIVSLYTLLERIAPNPVFALNRAVAVAMADGAAAGLDELAALQGEERLAGNHRVEAVRAHMLELAGDRAGAASAYRAAARLTTSLPERRYLESRAARSGSA